MTTIFAQRKHGEKLGKNPTISYLFIATVIKYSSLKMKTKRGCAETGSGPKAALYPTLAISLILLTESLDQKHVTVLLTFL